MKGHRFHVCLGEKSYCLRNDKINLSKENIVASYKLLTRPYQHLADVHCRVFLQYSLFYKNPRVILTKKNSSLERSRTAEYRALKSVCQFSVLILVYIYSLTIISAHFLLIFQ